MTDIYVLRRELRRKATEIIEGRYAFEQHFGRESAKPLRKIELDPREVLQLLDEIDSLENECEELVNHE